MPQDKQSGFRRGKIKKGAYKPKSQRAKSLKMVKAKKLKKLVAPIVDLNLASDPSEDMEFYQFYRNVYLNALPNYQMENRHEYFVDFRTLITAPGYYGETDKPNSIIAMTFIASESLKIWLKSFGCPLTIIEQGRLGPTHLHLKEINTRTIEVTPETNMDNDISATFHPKLLIIVFPTFLRLMVGTGNLLECDFDTFSNAFIVRDCPYTGYSDPYNNQVLPTLTEFIRASVGEHTARIENFFECPIDKFIWLYNNQVFVYNIPGNFSIDNKQKVGLFALRDHISKYPPSRPYTFANSKLHYLTSSLNKLSFRQLEDFARSLILDKNQFPEDTIERQELLKGFVRVIYPSLRYVQGSYLGESGAKCLFLAKGAFESFQFVRSVLRQYRGSGDVVGGGSIISHLKVFALVHDGIIDDNTLLYVGSHNFTVAAWGRLTTKGDITESFSYEFGTLFLPMKGSGEDKKDMIRKLGLELDAPEYSQGDVPFFHDFNEEINK